MSKAQAWPEPLADDDAAAVFRVQRGGLPARPPIFRPSAVPADRSRGVRGLEPPGDPWTAIADARTPHAVSRLV